MKYIDIRIRLPITRLGPFVDELPDYAQMVGYDKLAEVSPKKVRRNSREPSLPGKDTIGAKILTLLEKEPLPRREIMKTLTARKVAPRGISSAFHGLVTKSIITKQQDGSYVITK
jgi:hypothetical protein